MLCIQLGLDTTTSCACCILRDCAGQASRIGAASTRRSSCGPYCWASADDSSSSSMKAASSTLRHTEIAVPIFVGNCGYTASCVSHMATVTGNGLSAVHYTQGRVTTVPTRWHPSACCPAAQRAEGPSPKPARAKITPKLKDHNAKHATTSVPTSGPRDLPGPKPSDPNHAR